MLAKAQVAEIMVKVKFLIGLRENSTRCDKPHNNVLNIASHHDEFAGHFGQINISKQPAAKAFID